MENSNKIGKILKDIEDIDIIKELKRKLRRKKDLNSTCAQEQVAQLLYDLIQDLLKKGDIITQSFLLSLVEYLGIIYINNTELDVPLTESNKSQILERISILISEFYSITKKYKVFVCESAPNFVKKIMADVNLILPKSNTYIILKKSIFYII